MSTPAHYALLLTREPTGEWSRDLAKITSSHARRPGALVRRIGITYERITYEHHDQMLLPMLGCKLLQQTAHADSGTFVGCEPSVVFDIRKAVAP